MSTLPNFVPEPGRPHLERALGELPSFEPAATGWAAIEQGLLAEQAIAQALPQLPTYEPADDTWPQLAARLDQLAAPAARPRLRAQRRRTWQASLAALALLLVAGLAWLARPHARPELASRSAPASAAPTRPAVPALPPAVAAMPALPPAPGADALDDQGEQFIDAHCSSLPQVCQSGEFRQLREQLTSLHAQEQQLSRQTQRAGASPQLERRQAQVAIQKAAVTRLLISLLIS